MLPGLSPHKVEIQQGNYVTQEMVAKLKPGMTRAQVRFALGTPLITDPFHPDRWDYVYLVHRGGNLQEYRRIIVRFQDDKLTHIEGDVTAGRPGAAAAEAPAAKAAPAK